MRTSYSAIETYLQCPQKYKFQVIDKIRAPKSKEALFGTLIHGTLNFMFKSDPLFPTLDQVISYFRENWPSREILAKESEHDPLKHPWSEEEEKIYFEEGIRMIKKFYEKNAPWNFSVIDLESKFEIALADEKTGEIHILAGIIDRIDKISDNSYEIIDYKTSKRMPSQSNLAGNLQLSLYSLGLQKRWPHIQPENIKLSLYFVKHGEKLSTKTDAESIEKTKEHILKTLTEIQERQKIGKEFEPIPGPLCNWCAYRPLCPAWKHLYKTQGSKTKSQNEMDQIINEYFELKKKQAAEEARIAKLQGYIKEFMEAEGLTRVFGERGYITKKNQQRYQYDFEKIKSILSPLGKWEEVLKADETKLKKIMKEIPEPARKKIEDARTISKEFSVLTATPQKIKSPKIAGVTENFAKKEQNK